jgi:hypothetical protein
MKTAVGRILECFGDDPIRREEFEAFLNKPVQVAFVGHSWLCLQNICSGRVPRYLSEDMHCTICATERVSHCIRVSKADKDLHNVVFIAYTIE